MVWLRGMNEFQHGAKKVLMACTAHGSQGGVLNR